MSDLVFKLEIFSDLEQSHLPQLTELITPVFYDEGEMLLICGDDMRDVQVSQGGEGGGGEVEMGGEDGEEEGR